jgi:ABC-type transport system involved in multi-copper enzyme maturation permease subunit
MTALPIVVRELAVAARRPSTVGSRVGAAGVALALALIVWIESSLASRPGSGAIGSQLFMALVVVLSAYGLFWGARTSADCLSSEKRDGTLGLLFLTDLRGYDIVLGKLASASLSNAYGILAVFPVLAVSFVLGGVEGGNFLRAILVSASMLLLSLAAGILASALCVRASRSALLALGILAALNLGPVLAVSLWESLTGVTSPERYDALSPLSASMAVIRGGFGGSRAMTGWIFWASVWVSLAYSGIMMAGACWITPRSWQERAVQKSRGRAAKLAWRVSYGTATRAKLWRSRLLDENPYYWLAARERLRTLVVWLALLVLVGLSSFFLYGPGTGRGNVMAYSMSWMINCFTLFLRVWFVVKAAEHLADDRQTGAVELLLCTPLPPSSILAGQWKALRIQFGGPILALVAIQSALAFYQYENWPGMNRSWLEFAVVQVLTHGVFVLGFWAMGWCGMAMAAGGASVTKAAAGVFLRLVALPWILMTVTMILFMRFFAAAMSSGAGTGILRAYQIVPSILFAAIYIALGGAARKKLLGHFRDMASGQVSRRRPLLKRAATPLAT